MRAKLASLRWLPWRYLIRRLALRKGFLDPLVLLSRLERFSYPSEVAEPIELLRAGVIFHSRGLINTRAIQHNLDWVWPYWVERQFNPRDPAFIPRAFSITHVNLTHRNWTAVGLPACDSYVIVDPRGLVTPFYDGWSLDFWIIGSEGSLLLPSRGGHVEQRLDYAEQLQTRTIIRQNGLALSSTAEVELRRGLPYAVLKLHGRSSVEGWLVASVRPYNPEGISFVNEIETGRDYRRWLVNGEHLFELSRPPDAAAFSNYHAGDVFHYLPQHEPAHGVECRVGMASAALLYRLAAGQESQVRIEIPLQGERPAKPGSHPQESWIQALHTACRLKIPDQHLLDLFEQALRTLVLLAPLDIYPGPYTYKRFWFRDAAIMLNAFLAANLTARARAVIARFFPRQERSGYFLSQEGEWDSNGEVLWLIERFVRFSGQPLPADWLPPVLRGAAWIARKRLPSRPAGPAAGLLPAGFSAEHLGPNDHYYWDDFWTVAGLRAASRLCRAAGLPDDAARWQSEADDMWQCLSVSIAAAMQRNRYSAIPASPHRRMDTGAVGSLSAGYPLQLYPADHPPLLATARFLIENCLVHGGFFHEMIHAGINAYLTLHLAQILLRAGDSRFFELVAAVARLATSTGQWPEAIHPHTLGGCMGDGQHGWAAAEWVMMLRNMFVREEGAEIICCSGIPDAWLEPGRHLHCGPAATPYGLVTVTLESSHEHLQVRWQTEFRGAPPAVSIRLPRQAPLVLTNDTGSADFRRLPP